MTKITLKMILMLGLLSVLIVSVAGCTSSTTSNPTGSSQNNAITYANAYLNDSIKTAYAGQTVTGVSVLANGSNGAQLTATIPNATDNITTTITVNIQQFPSVSAATTFFNSQSFGYTLGTPAAANESITNPASAAYQDTMGHAPTVTNTAYKIESESYYMAQGAVIMQQNEFVIWGTLSAATV
jgi:hypothetical protein